MNTDERTLLGFWLYLMTDLVLFASLFAAFAVLRDATFGGPTGGAIFSLSFVLVETCILLTSSFACGFGLAAAAREQKKATIGWLVAAFALGTTFVALEVSEFARLAASGFGPSRSAFLSAYFSLVGTHGLHVFAGLVWLAALLWLLVRRGFTPFVLRKLALWSLFWHFLDLIWIFIFTIVYLLGVL